MKQGNQMEGATHILMPFVNRLRLRSPLTEEDIAAALALPVAALVEAKSNGDFVQVGDKLDHACLVVEGLVGRFEQTANGDRQITAIHIPGDMADLHSVVLPRTSWALQALTNSTIAQIPHEAIVAAADRHPGLARAFWRDCTVDASIVAAWMVNLGRRRAVARLAHLLCELKCRYEAIGRFCDDAYAMPMTQSHLSDILGLTNVHVNRMAKELREIAAADLTARKVRILDWRRLADVADFDPAYLHLAQQTEPSNAIH